MQERVQKIISNAGYCSRRKAEELIEQGKVKVNGSVIKLGDKAEKFKDEIIVEGRILRFAKRLYLLLNKPPGYVCSRDDPNIKENIYSLIDTKDRLYSVGRLDTMSEGAIILTNDGDFANKIMHPRYETIKEYKVILDKQFTKKDKEDVERGVLVEDEKGSYLLKGIKVRVDEEEPNIVFFTLHEGKNRVIRKILKKLGYRIAKLIRIKIGEIGLKGLALGTYRTLTNKEIKSLLKE